MAKQPKVITVKLTDRSHEYFDEVADSLVPSPGNNSASDDEVVNYAFEMLANLERIVGDPAEFIEDLINNRIRIIPIIPKPPKQVEKNDDHEK
jgi:hypothetical protein